MFLLPQDRYECFEKFRQTFWNIIKTLAMEYGAPDMIHRLTPCRCGSLARSCHDSIACILLKYEMRPTKKMNVNE